MTQRKRMSRRDFLRGSLVAGAAGVMAAGCVEGMPVAAPADGGAVSARDNHCARVALVGRVHDAQL